MKSLSASASIMRSKITIDTSPLTVSGKAHFEAAVGTTGTLLFDLPNQFLRLGPSFKYLLLPVRNKEKHYLMTIDSLLAFQTYWSPLKNFEIQAFLHPGAQLILGAGKVAGSPLLETGIGFQFGSWGQKKISLNLDIAYQVSLSKHEFTFTEYNIVAGQNLVKSEDVVEFNRMQALVLKAGVSFY